jgi:soluble lytic murein transglycosylase
MRSRSVPALLLLVPVLAHCVRASPARGPEAEPVPASASGPALENDDGVAVVLRGADEAGTTALPTIAERSAGSAAIRLARERSRAGDVAGAAAAYAHAQRSLPLFRDWVHVLAAADAAEAGDVRGAGEWLARLRPGSAAEWGWHVELRARRAGADPAGALRVAEAAAERTAGRISAVAWNQVAELRLEAGDASGAGAAYRQAMLADPRGVAGLAAARAAVALPTLSPADRLLVGRTLMNHGGLDRGVPLMEAALASGRLDPAEAAAARLELGRTLFRARRYQPAERHLREASAGSAEAMFLHGRSLFRAGRQADGSARFRETAQRFPGDPFAAEALFLLGDLAQGQGQLTVAREHYRQVLATGVGSATVDEAAARLASILVHSGSPGQAVQEMERFLAAPAPRRSAAALYWAGRGRLDLGEGAAAKARFEEALAADPFSFYGARAAERLGTSLSAVPLEPAPEPDPRTAAELAETLVRVDLLRELELREEAEFEMERARERFAGRPEALYAVAEAMIAHGQPIAGALLGRQIQQQRGAWDDRLLRIVYQFPYRELVVRESRRNGLDPFLVAGLIRQESFFNPVAVSPAGAVGLMQVMPETGRGLARRVGIGGYDPRMLREPELNVRLGTLFLADQMRRWGGRPTDAFAAYNAGPGRIARWRSLPEYRDDDVFVERIPIAETRDYVKRVRLNAHIYRRLYADPTAP